MAKLKKKYTGPKLDARWMNGLTCAANGLGSKMISSGTVPTCSSSTHHWEATEKYDAVT